MAKNILLVHGWGATKEKLNPLAESLSSTKLKIHNIPLPFFDLPEPNHSWTLEDFNQYLNDYIKNNLKDESYLLFGHSLGGRIALLHAGNRPKNLEGIILCCSAGVSRPHAVKRWLFLFASKILFPIKYLPGIGYLTRKIIHRLAGSTDYLRIQTPIKKQTFLSLVKKDLKYLLPQINIKTLIIWGKDDKITPLRDGKTIHKGIKNSSLIILEGTHTIPYTKPQEIASIIKSWL